MPERAADEPDREEEDESASGDGREVVAFPAQEVAQDELVRDHRVGGHEDAEDGVRRAVGEGEHEGLDVEELAPRRVGRAEDPLRVRWVSGESLVRWGG